MDPLHSAAAPVGTSRGPSLGAAEPPVRRVVVADAIRAVIFLLAVTLGTIAFRPLVDAPGLQASAGLPGTGYVVPAAAGVSCDWTCHRERKPSSPEPGTDFAAPYGTPVASADAGTVISVKSDPSTATGRLIAIRLDDGYTVRYLHLSESLVDPGQRVTRGQIIAVSGASGGGRDWHYGPHVHVTLWQGAEWSGPTVDFERYVGK